MAWPAGVVAVNRVAARGPRYLLVCPLLPGLGATGSRSLTPCKTGQALRFAGPQTWGLRCTDTQFVASRSALEQRRRILAAVASMS